MNVKFLKCSLGVVAVFSATHLVADPLPEWVSSYNANGTCYCTPEILPSLKNKIVPTPVGGQSIGQVCGRIGKGPGLVLENGLFNYPAYHDAQCGNGPYGADPEGCEGRMEAEDTVCTGSGPEWDLKAAYARPAAAQPAEAAPVQSAASSTIDEEADAQRARELAAQARARSEQEEAELARKLAEQARQRSIQQSEAAEQELARQLAEKARLRAVEEEEAADARLAQELAQKAAEPVVPAAPAESVAQASSMSEAELEDARIAKQLAAEARAEQERAEELKLAKARAAKAKAALAAAVDSDSTDAADATGSRSTPTPLAEQTDAEKKAARIRAAAAKAAQIRAADAKATKEAEEKLAKKPAGGDAVDKVESAAEPSIGAASGSAVRVPPGARGSAIRHSYVEVAPISYDFGGAGASLGGGLMMGSNWQITGRAAVVKEYTEFMVGIARSFVPQALNGAEINILAGLEHGNFDLGITELTDSGVILGSSLGYDLSGRANLSAGINYSSFFEGDPAVFGQLLFRVVRNLDFATRVEGGDNTNLSLGLRYHY